MPARKSLDRSPLGTTYVSVAKAAEYASVTPKTVYRWIWTGELPAGRAGKRLLRIDLADLDRMLRSAGAA